MNHAPVSLDVFSDYVCPFCYLEEPEIDALSARFGDRLTIRWRAFELRPAPEQTLDPDGDYLHDIWERAVYPMARERDMTLRLPRIQPRSRLAHEASAWAEAQSCEAGAALRHALFRGFFEDSLDLADSAALCDTAASLTCSLDVDDLRQALAEGRYTQQVLNDQQTAGELGIQGVPGLRFSLDGEHAGILEGAQPRRQLLLAVERLLDLIQQR
ncbi:DsbA family protein [Halomonas sp. ML-15]|uniref:DsbA family oxidoreductase n=1 Tax=Halomonas sp. ML-15 TaxID=2773305 RepID=UPI0017477F9F|nr:DsbA family protein [Halomonas sp. ML-15]MBD3896291.1 DsbA family protein [Halomonas sp. ML-15]